MKPNNGAATFIKTYEFKVDANTNDAYVELREEDGCKYVDNIPSSMTEEDKAAYIARIEKDGYVDIETAARMEAEKRAEMKMPPTI